MKDVINKILGKLHLVIILYALYGTYEAYTIHEEQLAALNQERETLEAEVETSNKKLKEINEYKKDIEASKARVEDVFKNIEKVYAQLPQEINDVEVLQFFSSEAESLNIKGMDPNNRPDEMKGFYIAHPYEITAKGTFLQFIIFLERINSSEKLFNVSSVEFAMPEGHQKGRFQIVEMKAIIETFKYNPNFKDTSGVEEVKAPEAH